METSKKVTTTPIRAANRDVAGAWSSFTRAVGIWMYTIWENWQQHAADRKMYEEAPEIKRLVQLMQTDGEMKILVEKYRSLLENSASSIVGLDHEDKKRVIAFCLSQKIHLPAFFFSHSWQKIAIAMNHENPKKCVVWVGNARMEFWLRKYWTDHVEFAAVLSKFEVNHIHGEDPDVHELLTFLAQEEEQLAAKQAEEALKKAATEAKQSPEQD